MDHQINHSVQPVLEKTIRLEEQMSYLKEAVADLKSTFNIFMEKSCENSKHIVEKIEQLEDKMEEKINLKVEECTLDHERIQQRLLSKVETLEKKIENLEKYKWYFIGGVFVLSAIMSNLTILKKFIV